MVAKLSKELSKVVHQTGMGIEVNASGMAIGIVPESSGVEERSGQAA